MVWGKMGKIEYGRPSKDISGVKLGDKRLDKRLEETVEKMTERREPSILSGCGSKYWAKAFYGLLSNERFNMEKMVESAQKATVERIKRSGIREVLLPQDTMDMNLNGHKKTEGLGYCSEHILGVKAHNCIALSPDGGPLGVMAQRYETRKSAKNEMTKEAKSERPIEEKESYRWLETAREVVKLIPEGVTPIIICDREGDFYELYAEMQSLNSSFVVRVMQDRETTDNDRSFQKLRRKQACGEVEVAIPRDTRRNIKARTAKMEVSYCAASIVKPKRASTKIPKYLELNLVRITEIGETSEEPIEWFLATNMPLANADDALKIVNYYVQRWKIECFHHVLKSGCNVEKIQQRTYDRILPVLFIYSVIAAFILALTYFARTDPDIPCDAFFDDYEWKILYRLVIPKSNPPIEPYSLKTAVDFLGQLGSFKHSPSDGDYGVKAVWKGLVCLFHALDVVDRLMG